MVSSQLLNGNDGADCVINFDESVKMRSSGGVDGALERSSGFVLLLKQRSLLFVTFDLAEATARVHMPTARREFSVFGSFEQFRRPS